MPENNGRPTAGSVEERTLPTAPIVDGRRLRGLIPYGVESRDLGGFREVIEPGALRGARLEDLIATREHDRSKLLARHPTTLTVEDRSDGFAWAAELPSSPVGEDVRVAVERGDLRSTSWRMVVARDRWEGDVRHVEAIEELRDVTVTAAPAYDAATAELRNRPETPTPTDTDNAATERQEDDMPEVTTTTEERTAPENASGGSPPGGGGETRGGNAPAGNLRVEDRAETGGEQRSVEDRFGEELRTVRKGETRALSTSSTLAPGELSSLLFDKLRSASAGLASGIRVIPTERDTVTFPRLTADVGPGWTAEAAAIAAGDPTLDSIVATPRKLAHRVEFSNEVVEDSDPSALDVVRDNLIAALGLKLDLGIYEGSGTAPEIRGLKNVTGINTVSMGTNGAALTNLDPFADALKALEEANASGGAIVLHPRTWAAVRKLKDTQGRPLVSSGTRDVPRAVFGVPVFVTSQLSIAEAQGVSTNASSAYVYQPDQVVLVRRKDVEVELDRSRLFNSDQSELRGKLRADLIVPNATAVTRILGITP